MQLSPQCHSGLFRSSSLNFSTPWLHSITKDFQGILPRSEYLHTPRELASQDMGPMLTMLALLAYRASCTPPDLASQDMGPVLTMLSLRVFLLHLHVEP